MLSFFTLFLVVIGAAVIATLVSARVVERARTVATLCAVGCTPRQATAAFVTEQAAVGLVGIALGTALGTWLAPGFMARSTALLNVTPVAAVDWPAVLTTGLCALALIASVAGLAASRASRGAVIDGLRGIGKALDAHPWRRSSPIVFMLPWWPHWPPATRCPPGSARC